MFGHFCRIVYAFKFCRQTKSPTIQFGEFMFYQLKIALNGCVKENVTLINNGNESHCFK